MTRQRKFSHLWLFQFAADFAAIVAAYYSTLLLRFYSAWGERVFTSINRFLGVRDTAAVGEMHETFYVVSAPRIIVFLTLTLCVLYALLHLYSARRFIRNRPVAWNVLVANIIALGLFYTYFYLRRNVFHPRSFFATLLMLNAIYAAVFRGLADRMLTFLRLRLRIDEWRALLLGSSEETGFLKVFVGEVHPHGIRIEHQIPIDAEAPFESLLQRVEQRLNESGDDMLIVADKRLSVGEIMQLLELADRMNLPMKVLSDKMNVLVANAHQPVDTIAGIPLVHFDPPSVGMRYAVLQRGASVVFASVATLLLLPAMVLIALLIKLTSRGPALFVQERLGVNRKPFRMLKFRTMYERSDEVQAQIEEFNESGKGLFKIRKDPRVTPVGRFLRRFSLDEMPQLLNVIRGDMVLVGPRPLPRRDFENYYEQWHYSRHSGKPGLTCLWQVSGRSDLDFHDMCVLDIYYLRNRSWMMDLRILFKTVWAVLFAKGAY